MIDIGPVVSRFGDAPRNIVRSAVLNLLPDRRFAGLIQKGVVIVWHHQERHQVFKHGPAPRNQDRLPLRGDEEATEREPMVLRYLALSDGDITAKPRLGSQ